MSGPDLSGLDPQARRFLAMVSLGASDATQVSPEDRRRSFEKLMQLSKPPAAAVGTENSSIRGCGGDIPVRIYTPEPARPILPGVIYYHGGGLVAGSLDTHDALCRALAHEAGCRIVSVGYRLAPEHPFPTPILDALVAARSILRQPASFGLAGDRIAIGGDSGGATLATIVCQTLRARFKAQVLLCPVLDFAGAHPSRLAYSSGFLLDAATMARDLDHYAPRRPLDDPRISPLRAVALEGLPRTILHTAGFDPLRDEGAAYAARLRAAGVNVGYTCHDTLVHHFYALTGVIPAAGAALSTIAQDIAGMLA